MIKFEQTYSDHPLGDLDSYFECPPDGVEIHVSVDEKSGVWLSANSQGFLLLAKLFAEIGLRELEPGWHTHFSMDLGIGNPAGPEFTIEKL